MAQEKMNEAEKWYRSGDERRNHGMMILQLDTGVW